VHGARHSIIALVVKDGKLYAVTQVASQKGVFLEVRPADNRITSTVFVDIAAKLALVLVARDKFAGTLREPSDDVVTPPVHCRSSERLAAKPKQPVGGTGDPHNAGTRSGAKRRGPDNSDLEQLSECSAAPSPKRSKVRFAAAIGLLYLL
jgi:hypothetical protein